MPKIQFLTFEQLLVIHEMMITEYGGSHGIRDRRLLESALMRPQMSFGGEDLYPSIYDKASALMHSIIMNHPFVDGNKRTGTTSAVTFLDLNGIVLNVSQDVFVETAVNVARKQVSQGSLAEWFAMNLDSIEG